MSSVLEQLPSHIHNLKFGDLLHALRERGLDDRAIKYEAAVVIECLLHGVNKPLELTVKELVQLFAASEDAAFSAGWDHAYKGKAYRGSMR